MQRWGRHNSIWNHTSKNPYPYLSTELKTDTVVIGAGVTGMTTAYLLQKAGRNVVVLTDEEVGQGTTGFSTGHLTCVPDIDFSSLISKFGQERSIEIVKSLNESIDLIEKLSHELKIQCGLERLPGFKYAEDDNEVDRLMKEKNAVESLGLMAHLEEQNPLPFPISKALKFAHQAQFDPRAYVVGLSERFTALGGQIFEKSHVMQVEDGSPCRVHTALGSITARDVVLATHTPIGIYLSLHTRLAPYFSYVMVAKVKDKPVPALYWDLHHPYNYLRPLSTGSEFWIIGGRDHKTGQEPHPMEKYLELEEYIQERFEVEEIVSYWGHELFESVDGLPYIGKVPFSKSLMTGTGYGGTGLTFGTAAGIIISESILGKENAFAKLYDPMRIKPFASAGNFIRENVNVAKWLFSDRLTHHEISQINSIPPEEGRIVEISGKKLAVYRDVTGHFETLSPVCTHLGCMVHWNGAEKTWDCPCHGGRYRPDGEVFSGPPLTDLQPVDLPIPKRKPAAEVGRVPYLSDLKILPEDLSPNV